MAKVEERNIGKRVYFRKSGDDLHIEINQKVERYKESLLMAWLAAWIFCGIYFIYELNTTDDSGLRTFLYISLAFWAFFFFRIGKVFLWRIIGKEIITVSNGYLKIKNAFGKFGREEKFKASAIKNFGLTKYDPKSFFQFMDQSFWIIGGDKIGFEYSSKKIRLGKQLEDNDAIALTRMLDKYINQHKKKN